MKNLFRISAAAAMLCLLFVPQIAADPPDEDEQDPAVLEVLGKIEEKMAEIKTVSAAFVQEKKLPILERPMVIKGRMVLEKPGNLAWHVDEPVRYRMVIRGSELRQWDEDTDRVQKLDLERNPAYRAMFQQLTSWFSGQYESLLEHYNLEIEAVEPAVLVFTPREGTMFEDMLAGVTIRFSEDESYIEELEILELNESLSTIRFHGTELNEEIEESDWRVRPDR